MRNSCKLKKLHADKPYNAPWPLEKFHNTRTHWAKSVGFLPLFLACILLQTCVPTFLRIRTSFLQNVEFKTWRHFMNRKHQGHSGRQNMQSQPRNARTSQFNHNSQYRQNYAQGNLDADQDYEGPHSRNFSGNSSWSAEDSAFDNLRNSYQSYRDTDYDLDGSTYGRSPRSLERDFGNRVSGTEYGSTFSDYEANRSPLRYDRDEDTYSSRFSPDRQAFSSERFGYPSNMNAWSGADRSNNPGKPAGRMGQNPTFSSQGYDSSHQDWGPQSSQRGFLGKGPKGYKRSDDRIKEDVCETLLRDHRIDASDIEVNVENAMVTLSGTVDNREAKRTAEMIIENLSGVDDVKNEIKVKKAFDLGSDSFHTSGVNRSPTSSTSSKSTSTKGSGHI